VEEMSRKQELPTGYVGLRGELIVPSYSRGYP